MANKEIALMAHLMRRAGFGATRDELDSLVEQGYEETVEQLLSPEDLPPVDMYMLYRYNPWTEITRGGLDSGQVNWLYRMVYSRRHLQDLKNRLGKFASFAGEKTASEIKPEQIEHWLLDLRHFFKLHSLETIPSNLL